MGITAHSIREILYNAIHKGLKNETISLDGTGIIIGIDYE